MNWPVRSLKAAELPATECVCYGGGGRGGQGLVSCVPRPTTRILPGALAAHVAPDRATLTRGQESEPGAGEALSSLSA